MNSRLLITIPTWNEGLVIERNLNTLLQEIPRLLPEDDVLIEVADNGSTDGTRDLVRRLVESFGQTVGRRPVRLELLVLQERGKGIAIRRSWERHVDDRDILAFMDADLATDIRHLPELITPLRERRASLVCGSRFALGAEVERGFFREAISRLYRLCQFLILHLPVKDAQCGFKAIGADVARRILPLCEEMTWLFDSELIARVARQRLPILEIPVAWMEDRVPERHSSIRVLRHGWGFVRGLWRIRQNVRRLPMS